MISATKQIECVMCGPKGKMSPSEFLEGLLDNEIYWLFKENLRLFMRCQQKGQTKMRKRRIILASNPEFEARVTLLAAQMEPPMPYGVSRREWFWDAIPRDAFYPNLIKLVGARNGKSSTLQEMVKIIRTTPPGKDIIIRLLG